jgi:hypothetical protein
MSDSPENTTGETNSFDIVHKGPVCQVAYTLNNAQPVACSIIGEQPMFYMDFEENSHEEDSFLDEAEIAILEKEVSKLKREIEEFERFSNFFDEGEEKKIQDFFDNMACISGDADSKTDDIAKAAL